MSLNLKTYDNVNVNMIRSTSNPQGLVSQARAITMKQDLSIASYMKEDDYKFLLDAEHTSLFEHVSYTFLISNVSRSFLAQITRHRMSSYTSGSQHYQNYSDYPLMVDDEVAQHPIAKNDFMNTIKAYNVMVFDGIPKEEARQILPNAMAVNLLWTVNARALINFLRLRLCNRNVKEMQGFANVVLKKCYAHFPELFMWVGPQCYMEGKCKQGKMSCGTVWEPSI